jgi:large subunit ribosomal protein L9
MEVILINDVDKLGYSDEIVKVKPGFGRNYLIPKGFAIVKNAANEKLLNERLKRREKIEAKQVEALKSMMSQLKDTKIEFGAKVGSNNKIFGSVQPIQLAEKLKAKGIEIDKRKISIKEGEIKEVGSYTILINLTKEEVVEIPLEVIAE